MAADANDDTAHRLSHGINGQGHVPGSGKGAWQQRMANQHSARFVRELRRELIDRNNSRPERTELVQQ